MAKKKFILSNSRVNAYGFRLLTEGADLARFTANPVMLYNHKMGADRDKLPLGIWAGLSIDGDDIVGTTDFDMEDSFAASIARKVGKGHLRGASVGFDIIEVSNDPAVMLPGQTLPTVTKWSPFEASIVDIPANEGALCLRHNGELILLDSNTDLSRLSFFQDTNDTPTTDPMKKYPIAILTLLALTEGATDEQVLAALTLLSKEKADLETALATEKKKFTDHLSKDAQDFIESEAKRLKLSETQKAHFLKLAETSADMAKQTISMVGERQTLSGMSGGNAGKGGNAGNPDAPDPNDRANWTHEEWSKKDSKGLLFIKKNDPERYQTLITEQAEANRLKHQGRF